MNIHWRKNALALIGMAYLALVVIALGLVAADETLDRVYDAIDEPLMVLIGGSIALAKDIVHTEPKEDEQ